MEIQNSGRSIKDKLGNYFHKIFSPSHIAYTIFFFLELLILISFNFVPIANIGDVGLFLATLFAMSFIFLMILGISSKLESQLFSKAFDQYKVLYFLLSIGLSFIIVLLYFLFGRSNQLSIQFLGWDLFLPGFYIIIYFGWNLSQIFFLRKPFTNISMKANNKVIKPIEGSIKPELLSIIFLTIALIFPFLAQLGSYFGFYDYFSGDATSLAWFNAWNIIMYLIMLLTSYRLTHLFLKSRTNKSYNIFSSVLYILIWVIIWYRSFSFINSFRSATSAIGIDTFRILTDIFLMIFTAVLVLRGLGEKVYKVKLFNPNNLAFFLYAFTILYFEGQIIMITGAGSIVGTYADRNQINLVNNFLILLISLVFYWYYSKFVLEKNGLIVKTHFNQEEVIEIVEDFKDYLVNSGAINPDKISEWEMEGYLKKKRLKIDKDA